MERDRSSLAYQVRYALRQPARVLPHARRVLRNRWIRLRYRDHVDYYREVMRHNASINPDLAVGTPTRRRWMALGQLQYDYLVVEHGLQPTDRLLEIGCGNLRGGWRFIDHLEPGHYYGVDISPDILFAAQETLAAFDLQAKLPHLTPVRDLSLGFLPPEHFDVAHAHSVFSHCPLHVIEESLHGVARVLRPGGFFDFTYNETTGAEHHVQHEDYYYRTETLIRVAAGAGLVAEPMHDWDDRHKQRKLRARRAETA